MSSHRLDVIRMRTKSEIKAYYDGYCACEKQFKEYLEKYSVEKAEKEMERLIAFLGRCVKETDHE